MAYVYRGNDFNPRKTYLGVNDQCVALVRFLDGAPAHLGWKQGISVKEAMAIPNGIAPGTAIATFINGIYPSLPGGDHAAVFVKALPDGTGFVVFDQWAGHLPQLRTLYFNRPGKHSVVDRGEAFSVIQ
jgi:hypothetical protein